MRFDTLDEWLSWQEELHPKKIDLGLDRVQEVLRRMGLDQPSFTIITVAGTNGKGSCVAMLGTILDIAGYRVGAYTSPHLLSYNERIQINGKEMDDAAICQAFELIDQQRGKISLSYFEFSTLAAIQLFQQAELDIVILEIGLGGRLDAVNALDSDVALVTSIGIDHIEWLGNNRESIGAEKAGIFRPHQPAVCGDAEPPASLLAKAEEAGARLYCLGRDFTYQTTGDKKTLADKQTWDWWCSTQRYEALPEPALSGSVQKNNAAAVIMVLELLKPAFHIDRESIEQGLQTVKLPGRFQLIPGEVPCLLDVAHNPDGARVLADTLRQHPCDGRTYAVCAMLQDKDIEGVFSAMSEVVDYWVVAGLDTPRGASGEQMAAVFVSLNNEIAENTPVKISKDVPSAYQWCRSAACPGDRIIVFGSFYTVSDMLAYFRAELSLLNPKADVGI